MTRKKWFLFTFFLPLIVSGLGMGISAMAATVFPILWTIGMLLFGAPLVFGGVQYLIFIGLVSWWAKDKTADEIQRSFMWLPVLFYPVCMLGLSLCFFVTAAREDMVHTLRLAGMALLSGGFLAAFVILYGYVYVFLVEGLTVFMQKIGRIRD